jgi:N-acyl-L-homoserine lactone synthetase
MTPSAVSQAIHDVADQFTVELARTAARLEACHRLRYEAHHTDRRFLAGQNGLEYDEFDEHSAHVVLVSRQSGAVMGTARLVLPLPAGSGISFPLQQVCRVPLPADMPMQTTADVSCFALRQDRSFNTSALMRLGLVQGLIRASTEFGLTHWCAIMEPSLLRLLGMTGLHFIPIGPLVEYRGPGQPCYNSIACILSGACRERPPVGEYLSDTSDPWTTGERSERSLEPGTESELAP